MKTKKICLITTIENKNNTNQRNGSFTQIRDYEKEAIKCFTHWRKNAGWLKDIPIYTHCPTHNTITENTKKELKKLNVIYLEKYLPETENYKNGFINVYATGMYLEKILTEDIFIHIDLDMNIIKELPKKLFIDELSCGIYSKSSLEYQRSGELIFDTGFIISTRKNNFYTNFFKDILIFISNGYDKTYREIQKTRNMPLSDYDVEEYFLDKLVHEKLLVVNPIKNYQLGEGYPSVLEYTDKELENIYFWHEHLIIDKNSTWAKEKIKQKIIFLKRIKKMKEKK